MIIIMCALFLFCIIIIITIITIILTIINFNLTGRSHWPHPPKFHLAIMTMMAMMTMEAITITTMMKYDNGNNDKR